MYSQPEASPAMSIASDDDTDSTKSDGEYDSECDSDVEMRMEDDVDAPDGIDSDGDVDMERDGEDEDDQEEEDEMEEEEVDEEEDEDADEDNGKEPRMIGQGEMVHTLADDADTMVDDQPTVLPEQGQEMREHTPQLVLATGAGNPPAVRVLTCGSVRFGSRTGQKPEPLLSWRVDTRPGHRTTGIWPGWNRTAVPNLRFLQVWLQLSMRILIVLRHDLYVDYAEL